MSSPARWLLLAPCTLSLACSEVNTIAPGGYTRHIAPLASARLEVSADKTSVTITPAGEAAIRRSARPWDRSRWPTLCPRGLKDTSSEVLDLGPEPLVIGGTRLEQPVLVANCLHKPTVELGSLEADGRPSHPALEFER